MFDYLQNLNKLGVELIQGALQHDVDQLQITIEPEFGYVMVKTTKPDGTVHRAYRFDQFPEVEYDEIRPIESGNSHRGAKQ